MTEQRIAAEVARRRERLGMDAIDLAEAAGMSRNTVAKLERGENVRGVTVSRVLRALEKLEAEMGVGEAGGHAGPVTFTLRGASGVEVTVAGPIEDLAALEEAAFRLLNRLAHEDAHPAQP